MIGEFDLYGVFIPPLLLWVALAWPASALLRRLLDQTAFYRLVWHRPLFDLALFVIVLGAVVALTAPWTPS